MPNAVSKGAIVQLHTSAIALKSFSSPQAVVEYFGVESNRYSSAFSSTHPMKVIFLSEKMAV